jgi:hypothetical protein
MSQTAEMCSLVCGPRETFSSPSEREHSVDNNNNNNNNK